MCVPADSPREGYAAAPVPLGASQSCPLTPQHGAGSGGQALGCPPTVETQVSDSWHDPLDSCGHNAIAPSASPATDLG